MKKQIYKRYEIKWNEMELKNISTHLNAPTWHLKYSSL